LQVDVFPLIIFKLRRISNFPLIKSSPRLLANIAKGSRPVFTEGPFPVHRLITSLLLISGMTQLGVACEFEQGALAHQSIVRALAWYLAGAAAGESEAQRHLGFCPVAALAVRTRAAGLF
jgi:hypothetical protein